MSNDSVSTLSSIIHALSCTCRTNPAFNKTWWLEVSAEFDDWYFVAGINLLDNLLRPYVALLDLLASLLALRYSHLRKSNVWIVIRVVAGLVTWLSKRKRKRTKKFNQPRLQSNLLAETGPLAESYTAVIAACLKYFRRHLHSNAVIRIPIIILAYCLTSGSYYSDDAVLIFRVR